MHATVRIAAWVCALPAISAISTTRVPMLRGSAFTESLHQDRTGKMQAACVREQQLSSPPRHCKPIMAVDGSTDSRRRAAREMRWEAVATATEPCSDSDAMSAFLAKGAKSDLILRVDESVVACDAVKNDGDEPSVGGARRYRASIAPLALPGLLVETTALIRVEAIPEGVRYVTERCDNAFSGRFGRLVGSLPRPSIAVCTELRVRDQALVGRSDFLLTTPLPGWWPIPDRVMATGGALIKRLFERDTELSVRRVVAECEREIATGDLLRARADE